MSNTTPSTPGLQHGKFDPPICAQRLTAYLGEDDKHGGLPLYEAIVRLARDEHMAGATVLRGPMGFGAASRIHTAKIVRLSQDLPVVVQIVDTPDKIAAFVPKLTGMIGGGLVTIEDVSVAAYHPG
ncbi:MAG TPA: DUF190 domain-containing protein [Phycisphaerales bacterium]|nr:DUF190 domain-containing protein [Phycisphaerales bacterium]